MPTKSVKTAKAPAASKPTARANKAAPTAQASVDHKFPFAQYASVLGVHLVLVGFTALYLPRTMQLFAPLTARNTDRPQSKFMEALTASPSSTLCWVSLGLTLLELWWANWVRKWSFQQTADGTEIDIKLARVKFNASRWTKLWNATAFTLCAALATHLVVVMFGAPLTTHVVETALLAFVIAILTTFTPAFVLGYPSWNSDTPSMITRLTWTRLFVELSPKNAIEFAMVHPALGTVIGAWLGAIPIALDWDRPWQAWPLTPLFGSLGGYIIGTLVGFAFITTKWLAIQYLQSLPSKSKTS